MGIVLRTYFLKNITRACSRKGNLVKTQPLYRYFTVDTKNKQRKRPLARDTEAAHATSRSNL